MDLFELSLKWLQQGTPAGVVVALLVLGIGLWLRIKGFIAVGTADKKIVSADSMNEIHGKLDAIGSRLTKVETEVKDSATRRELHDLELSITRFEGRMTGIEASLRGVGAAVTRIEDFMLAASERATRRRGE